MEGEDHTTSEGSSEPKEEPELSRIPESRQPPLNNIEILQ